MNSEEELMIAKRTAERAGYKVEMPAAKPVDQIADNAARIAAAKARLGYGAAPAAQPAPKPASLADNLERLALAARTAERAGYTVRKIEDAPAPAPEAAPAPAPEAKPEYAPWLRGAARFMKRED